MHITCIFEKKDFTLCETKNFKFWVFWGNSGEFWGNQTKSFPFVFHSFSQVRNTFPSQGNLIPLISPVTTVKTGKNSCEKKLKGIHRETWIPFPFQFISPTPPPPYKFQLHSTVIYFSLIEQYSYCDHLKFQLENLKYVLYQPFWCQSIFCIPDM